MKIKEFLKPELKKIILPLALIFFFSIIISNFYHYGHVEDKYDCELISLGNEYHLLQDKRQENIKKNDTIAINQSTNDMKVTLQKLSNNLQKMSEEKYSLIINIKDIKPVVWLIKSLDPILPVSCSLTVDDFCEDPTNSCHESIMSPIDNCRHYYSKNTHDCLYSNADFVLFAEEYRKISINILILNIILLFIEGYLISSMVLFAYRKVKNK